MTTYTTIADSEIDPESPGTTTLFTKIRDNPIAITEGAVGAPKIVYGALDLSEDIVNGDITDSTITDAKLASPSSLKLIEKIDAGTIQYVSFTSGIDSTYSSYVLKVDGIRSSSNAVHLQLEVSTNGGSSYLGGVSYRYALTQVTDAAVETHAGSTGTSSIRLLTSITTHSNYRGGFTVNFSDLADTTNYKNIYFSGAAYAATALQNISGAGVVATTSAIDAFRLGFSAGNITDGTFALYGVAK